MFKYEMQAPSSGYPEEMRLKGLVATPADSSQSQTSRDPWSLAVKWGKGMHLGSQVTKSSVSALGCKCQPRQGSNNEGYVQRKGIVEYTKMRGQWRWLSQVLLTVGTKSPGLQGRKLGTSL